MNKQNLKNLFLKVFYFCKILKMRKKNYEIRKLFDFVLLYKEKMSQLKVEIEDGRELP